MEGNDLSYIFTNYLNPRIWLRLPFEMGHEYGGQVNGTGASNFTYCYLKRRPPPKQRKMPLGPKKCTVFFRPAHYNCHHFQWRTLNLRDLILITPTPSNVTSGLLSAIWILVNKGPSTPCLNLSNTYTVSLTNTDNDYRYMPRHKPGLRPV